MFKTVESNEEADITEKKSKFIANIFYITSEEEAEEKIRQIKRKHNTARHHCYAYRIIRKNEIINKSSDDGEPGGTAGLPMLNVLLKNDLINVLAITIRYFGGIKLGAGGLVRAYTKSLTEALKKCQIVTIEKGLEIVLSINYDMQKSLEYLLKDCEIVEKNYQEQITYRINIKKSYLEKLKQYNPVIIKETYIEKKS